MIYTVLLSFFALDESGGGFNNIASRCEQFFMAVFEGSLPCGGFHPYHFDSVMDVPIT